MLTPWVVGAVQDGLEYCRRCSLLCKQQPYSLFSRCNTLILFSCWPTYQNWFWSWFKKWVHFPWHVSHWVVGFMFSPLEPGELWSLQQVECGGSGNMWFLRIDKRSCSTHLILLTFYLNASSWNFSTMLWGSSSHMERIHVSVLIKTPCSAQALSLLSPSVRHGNEETSKWVLGSSRHPANTVFQAKVPYITEQCPIMVPDLQSLRIN